MQVTLLLAALLPVIAGSQSPVVRPSTPLTGAGLVRALGRQSMTVVSRGRAPRDAFPFLSVRATRLTVNGHDVHVFEYPTVDGAARDASAISPAGTPIGSSQIAWMAPPRFYWKDRLLVLYVGTSLEIAQAIETVLGPPFAGLGADGQVR